MYTNLNRKGWVYVSKNKNEMPRQESNNSQGQGSHGAPGKGGKKPGPPKPKNIGKTIKTLMHYVGRYKALLALVIILIVIKMQRFLREQQQLFMLIHNKLILLIKSWSCMNVCCRAKGKRLSC